MTSSDSAAGTFTAVLGRALDQRWGILQTMFFGNQNGAGQFHRSAYTEGKLRAIAAASSRIGMRDAFDPHLKI